jgi:cytochrome c oxidase assembly factor CtaG
MALAPTTADLASDWVLRPVVITLLIAAAALYFWGVARVWRRHPARPWPLARIGSFLAGLGVLAVALLSAVE